MFHHFCKKIVSFFSVLIPFPIKYLDSSCVAPSWKRPCARDPRLRSTTSVGGAGFYTASSAAAGCSCGKLPVLNIKLVESLHDDLLTILSPVGHAQNSPWLSEVRRAPVDHVQLFWHLESSGEWFEWPKPDI